MKYEYLKDYGTEYVVSDLAPKFFKDLVEQLHEQLYSDRDKFIMENLYTILQYYSEDVELEDTIYDLSSESETMGYLLEWLSSDESRVSLVNTVIQTNNFHNINAILNRAYQIELENIVIAVYDALDYEFEKREYGS